MTGAAPGVYELRCQVQPYAWGSTTFIPRLLGYEADGTPQAELWIGAHPSAPSTITAGGVDLSLADFIAANPAGTLGAANVDRFGPELPFLMKVLSSTHPLSLQAHPSKERAIARFAQEDAAGIDRSSPLRSYRDRNHKPELICALTEFEALCGFRSLDETVTLLQRLDSDAVRALIGRLNGLSALGGLFEDLLRRRIPIEPIIDACRAAAPRPEFRWCVDLADQYPNDPGAVISLLMNYVLLQPGEALALPSGNLHAYLRGSGIELMANSDNVLRGGLTTKHVDVDELLAVVDCTPLADPVIRPTGDAANATYPSPSDEFQLHRLDLGGATDGLTITVDGPEVLLCVRGTVTVDGMNLTQGKAAFVPAMVETYRVGGDGELYRATLG